MDTVNDIHPVVQISRASIEKRDLNILIRVVQPRKPKVVLEIGTWKGFSAEVWKESFHPQLMITVEKDRQFEDAVLLDGNVHYLWETDSTLDTTRDKIKEMLGGQTIDFLFIDADHNYNAVRRDWDLYYPLVSEGGVVAMHDICYTQDNCQVPLLWQQLKRNHYYVESNIGEGSTGFGFIYKLNEGLTVAQKSQIL